MGRFYSLNVIEKEYRGFIPILTICQYFKVGKCNSLRGPFGAYVLYDDESYKKLIITKLDQVIDKLDSIAQTQQMLYEAVLDANRISQSIADANMDLLESNQTMAQNIEKINYNTKRNELNTSVSAYVDVFSM